MSMSQNKVYTAIGLMSGTSLDGEIDVALIRTDGHAHVEVLDFKPYPYDLSVRDKVRGCFGKRERDEKVEEAERLVTDLHIAAVKASGFDADIIGFHGQTITHDPARQFTWQLGDGRRLAQETGIDVIYDLRSADVAAGGQGAPLIPVYHQAITAGRKTPLAVLNLGGVGNVTYSDENTLLAFDTGPANAMIDDYLGGMDEGGQMARNGLPNTDLLERFLAHPYFETTPPKSLDRNDFKDFMEMLPNREEDAVATLAEFTVRCVLKSKSHFPQAPKEWIVCGGGRKNDTIMEGLAEGLKVPVKRIEEIGFNGDAIEAQGFAYLAVRSLKGLPLTYPLTTGVKTPLTGGKQAKAK